LTKIGPLRGIFFHAAKGTAVSFFPQPLRRGPRRDGKVCGVAVCPFFDLTGAFDVPSPFFNPFSPPKGSARLPRWNDPFLLFCHIRCFGRYKALFPTRLSSFFLSDGAGTMYGPAPSPSLPLARFDPRQEERPSSAFFLFGLGSDSLVEMLLTFLFFPPFISPHTRHQRLTKSFHPPPFLS